MALLPLPTHIKTQKKCVAQLMCIFYTWVDQPGAAGHGQVSTKWGVLQFVSEFYSSVFQCLQCSSAFHIESCLLFSGTLKLCGSVRYAIILPFLKKFLFF